MTEFGYFHLEFLIEHLEYMKPQDTDDIGWVFTIMVEVGITFSDVLFIYEKYDSFIYFCKYL